MKLVQFEDNTWGIRRTVIPFLVYEYLSETITHFWRNSEYVNAFCKFDTKEDAMTAYSTYLCKFLIDKSSKIKVINVFKID